ncbi:MAG TPA: glycoside hydrolase family 25 protein [Candidatus Udaeobacter sp.]|nr:glycoside hydrolase family 25 protein [Candidatus Udaeobacter sp.]
MKTALAKTVRLLDISAAILRIVMKNSISRAAFLLFLAPTCALAATSVVNMSHYDLVRPDFGAMRREGIVGVIHEASYPPFTRDSKYIDRQMGALQAGLLWGAYHYGNGSDPTRQADHFLSVVSNAWAQANPVTRPNAGVLLVLDFEKNGHYPGGSMRPDQAVAFIERIHQRTGVYPGVYSGEYHLAQVLNSARVTPAQRQTLTNCWLWVANYSKEPRATAPWSYWALWQYTGDGKCRLPRSSHPIRIANMRKAELNIFRGSRSDLTEFWQRRGWDPAGGKPRRESERPLTAEL